jgi:hypothetical protein
MECARAAAQETAADWARTVGRERFAVVRKTLRDYIEGSRARQLESAGVSAEVRETHKGAERPRRARRGSPDGARRRR